MCYVLSSEPKTSSYAFKIILNLLGKTKEVKNTNGKVKSNKKILQNSKMDQIEAKIREKSIMSFKSDKLISFDMFAPKTSKPKLVMPKPIESPKPTPNTPIMALVIF